MANTMVRKTAEGDKKPVEVEMEYHDSPLAKVLVPVAVGTTSGFVCYRIGVSRNTGEAGFRGRQGLGRRGGR